MADRVGSFCFVSCILGSFFLGNTSRAFLGVCTGPLTQLPSLTPDFPANSIDQAEGGRPRPLIQAAHKRAPSITMLPHHRRGGGGDPLHIYFPFSFRQKWVRSHLSSRLGACFIAFAWSCSMWERRRYHYVRTFFG